MSFDSVESGTYSGKPYELYRFSMGSQLWLLTSCEESREYLTETYAPEAIESTEIEHSQETTTGTIEVSLPMESSIAKEFIAYIPPQPMWLTKYRGHDGDSDVLVEFRGRVQKVSHGDRCVLTVESGASAIRKKIPPMVYQNSCNQIHYSTGCGALDAIAATPPEMGMNVWPVKVGAISGFNITINGGDPVSSEFVASWAGGNPSTPSETFPLPENQYPRLAWGFAIGPGGHRMMISRHIGWNIIELKAPMPGLQVGDTIQVIRGCRRSFEHCLWYGRTASFFAFDIQSPTNPFQGLK